MGRSEFAHKEYLMKLIILNIFSLFLIRLEAGVAVQPFRRAFGIVQKLLIPGTTFYVKEH
jgi:hypothetical protein